MRGLAVDGEALEFLMGFDEKSSARSFVGAARFHPDEAIFDKIGTAYAVFRGNSIERVEQIDGTEIRTVHRDGSTGLEYDFSFFGLVWTMLGCFDLHHPRSHGVIRWI